MTQRWEFLAPWWCVLQTHELRVAVHHPDFREELHGLDVSVYPRQLSDASEEDANTRISRLRDALELALLLAIADRSEFDRVAQAHARVDKRVNVASVLENHPEDSINHVELQINTPKPNTAALAIFITPQLQTDRDPSFQQARSQLLAQISPRETAKHAASANMKISVHLATRRGVPLLERMREVEAAESVRTTLHTEYPFVAAPFSIFVQPSVFSEETIAVMNAWHNRGSRLPFERVWINSERWPSDERFTDALSAIFHSPSSTSTTTTGTSPPRGFDKVVVFSTPDSDRFAQICSTVMHTDLIRSLSLPFDPREPLTAEERRFRLRWVFFALFSRWATHSIQQVFLGRIQFSEAEIEDLHQLLQSENPLALLHESTGSKAPRSELMRVLMTQERALQPPTDRSVGSRGIRSLKLQPPSLETSDGRGIFAFFQWFGPQLEELTLTSASFEDENALSHVLQNCPSLKRLRLPCSEPELLPQLLRAYEVGTCKASSLDLSHLVDQNDSHHVTRMFETLADQTQRMAQTVTELRFSDRAHSWPMGDAVIAAMRAMLETNTVLEYFERMCKPAHNAAYVALCREFNHATIAIKPVGPRSKLAFLSVVSNATMPTPMAMQLDSEVITQIFDMAAKKIQRRVHLGSDESMLFHC